MAEKDKAVAVIESALPALPAAADIREVFEANFEGITPGFESVKIPAAGGLAWTVGIERPQHRNRRAECHVVG